MKAQDNLGSWIEYDLVSILKIVLPSLHDSDGSRGSPAGAQDEVWNLHPHGGHRNIARMEHAVQVSVIEAALLNPIVCFL